MKVLNWIAWISGGIGLVFLLLAAISLIVKAPIIGEHIINFFHVANSFFLLTIALFVFLYRCQCKKE
jgi:hypothetical protein